MSSAPGEPGAESGTPPPPSRVIGPSTATSGGVVRREDAPTDRGADAECGGGDRENQHDPDQFGRASGKFDEQRVAGDGRDRGHAEGDTEPTDGVESTHRPDRRLGGC